MANVSMRLVILLSAMILALSCSTTVQEPVLGRTDGSGAVFWFPGKPVVLRADSVRLSTSSDLDMHYASLTIDKSHAFRYFQTNNWSCLASTWTNGYWKVEVDTLELYWDGSLTKLYGRYLISSHSVKNMPIIDEDTSSVEFHPGEFTLNTASRIDSILIR